MPRILSVKGIKGTLLSRVTSPLGSMEVSTPEEIGSGMVTGTKREAMNSRGTGVKDGRSVNIRLTNCRFLGDSSNYVMEVKTTFSPFHYHHQDDAAWNS